jgi:hypothetical protein
LIGGRLIFIQREGSVGLVPGYLSLVPDILWIPRDTTKYKKYRISAYSLASSESLSANMSSALGRGFRAGR